MAVVDGKRVMDKFNAHRTSAPVSLLRDSRLGLAQRGNRDRGGSLPPHLVEPSHHYYHAHLLAYVIRLLFLVLVPTVIHDCCIFQHTVYSHYLPY